MVLPRLKSVVLTGLCLAWSIVLCAQTCLDDFCFLTKEYATGIERDLSQGYRAFIVSQQIEDQSLKAIANFLERQPTERVVLIVEGDSQYLHEKLQESDLAGKLYSPSQADSLFGVVITPQDRFFVFARNNPRFLSLTDYLWQQPEPGQTPLFQTTDLSNDFTYLNLAHVANRNKTDSLVTDLIQKKGRLPNFLEVENGSLYKEYVDSLNAIKRFKAIVLHEGKPLKDVSWKQMPDLVSTGKIHMTERIVSPQKTGYRFSPDVSTYTPANEHVIKVFYANYKDINDELMLYLNFDENIVNQARPEDKYLYGFVAYAEDDQRGMYSQFNGQSNYIDFGIPAEMDFQEIAVSAWIKPDNLGGSRALVGIGEVFSAKITEGRLTFTTPAIRDHRTDSVLVKTGQWQHVAFVYQANKEVNFYHNGRKVTTKPASDITITSNSLLIGNNLWSEYFHGGIDDLYIWNRVLTDEEVTKIYRQGLEKQKAVSGINGYVLVLCALLGLLAAYAVWKRKNSKRSTQEAPVVAAEQPQPKVVSNRNEAGIYLFGGFRLINKEGVNLSDQFSPKRKELFVLVLLYTFRKNGINSKQMSEILWEGHSFESAKNNRSTQMKRIREILAKNTGIEIGYDNKNWKITIEDGVRWDYSDYKRYINALKVDFAPEEINQNVAGLLGVINQGVLLPNMQYEWLDPIKGQLSEEIIETLTPLMENAELELSSELKLKITNAIFSLDPLNERALKVKIKLLVSEGNHTLAKNAFDQFCHSYVQFYGERYPAEFSAFV